MEFVWRWGRGTAEFFTSMLVFCEITSTTCCNVAISQLSCIGSARPGFFWIRLPIVLIPLTSIYRLAGSVLWVYWPTERRGEMDFWWSGVYVVGAVAQLEQEQVPVTSARHAGRGVSRYVYIYIYICIYVCMYMNFKVNLQDMIFNVYNYGFSPGGRGGGGL